MKMSVRIPGEITEDGKLLVELPAELPRGRVVVTLEPEEENDFDVREEDLRGLGLSAQEIAAAPEIGSWADEEESLTGAEFVERVRHASVRYEW